MEVECPQCESDQAYHNGVSYECPDCNHQWSDGVDLFDYLDDENE